MIEQFTQDFISWLTNLPAISIYGVLFAIAYLENIVPPIPGDLLIVLAGYLAAEGIILLAPVLALTTIGSVFGFMTLFTLGWLWGDEIKLKRHKFWLFKYVQMKYYARVRSWMRRWGQGVVLANRFLAGTRSIVSLTAGIVQTRIDYTIASSFISSLLWNAVLLGLGWIIQENWEIIGRYLNIYGRSVLVLLILIVILRIVWRRYRRVKKAVNIGKMKNNQ